jgi:ankyrin repeat domain-containing protein 50
MLLAAGADVDEENGQFEGCALQIASLRGFKEIVRILLQVGAEVNHFGGTYGSSLQAASTRGDNYWSPIQQERDYEGAIRSLLAAGADVNQQGGKYGSPLKAALAYNNADIANILLEAGATPVDETDVPIRSDRGWLRMDDSDESSDSDSNQSSYD